MVFCVLALLRSVADPHHFDVDPDPVLLSHFDADPYPAFHFDADPDPDPSLWRLRLYMVEAQALLCLDVER
jgi:hypothetical protein